MCFDTIFILYDLESTSNDPFRDHIISIACSPYVYNGKTFSLLVRKEIEQHFHSKVKTERKIDLNAFDVHGLSRTDILNSPSFLCMLDKMKHWIKSLLHGTLEYTIFIAHNGSKFDDIMLISNMINNGVDAFNYLSRELRCKGFIDSIVLVKDMVKKKKIKQPTNRFTGYKSFRLGDCYYTATGKYIVNAHDALVDTKALGSILSSEIVNNKLDITFLYSFMKRTVETVANVVRIGKIRKFPSHSKNNIKRKLCETKLDCNPLVHKKLNGFCLECLLVKCEVNEEIYVHNKRIRT